MKKINTESDLYKIVDNATSLLAGYGAGLIVDSFCNALIFYNKQSSFSKVAMTFGKVGINTLVAAKVMKSVKKNNKKLVEVYNTIADSINSAKQLA